MASLRCLELAYSERPHSLKPTLRSKRARKGRTGRSGITTSTPTSIDTAMSLSTASVSFCLRRIILESTDVYIKNMVACHDVVGSL